MMTREDPKPGERWLCKHPKAGHQAFNVEHVEGGVVVMVNGSRFPLTEWSNPPDAYHLVRWEPLPR